MDVLPHTRRANHLPQSYSTCLRISLVSLRVRASPVTKYTCHKRTIIGISHVFFFKICQPKPTSVQASSSISKSIARLGEVTFTFSGPRVLGLFFFYKKNTTRNNLREQRFGYSSAAWRILLRRNIPGPDAHSFPPPPHFTFPDHSAWASPNDVKTIAHLVIASASPSQSPVADRIERGSWRPTCQWSCGGCGD